jgi:hypothetical protein
MRCGPTYWPLPPRRRSTGIERVQPGSDRRPIPLDPQHCSPCSVNEDLAKIGELNAEELRFRPVRRLA